MRQKEYIDKLRFELRRLPKDEIEDIIADYTEHFECATNSGKSEEEITSKLGTPQSLAKIYIAQRRIDQVYTESSSQTFSKTAKNYMRALLAFLILTPLNFIVALGPFLTIVVVMITMWASWGSIIAASFAAYFNYLFSYGAPALNTLTHMSIFFFWIGTLGLCTLLAMVLYLVSKVILKAIHSYIKWNVNTIMNKTRGEYI